MNRSPTPLNSDTLWRIVIRSATWSIFFRMITAFFGVATTALLAKWLGADELGIFLTLSAWILFLTTPAQLGLGETAVREISALQERHQIDDVSLAVKEFLTLGVWGALAGGGVMLVVGAIRSVPLGIVIGAAAWVSSSAFLGLTTDLGRGFMNKWAMADFGRFLSALLFLIALVASLCLHFQDSLFLVFSLRAGASVGGLVAVLFILFRLMPKKDHRKLLCIRQLRSPPIHWLSKSWPILSHHLIRGVLVHADIILLGLVRPMQEVAFYGVASRLVALIAFPMVSLHTALAPGLSKLYSSGNWTGLQKMVRRAVLVSGIPALIGYAVLAIAGPFVLTHFYGHLFIKGFPILMILCLSKLIYVFSGPAGLTLLMTGWQKTMFRITLLAAFIMLGLGAWWGNIAGGIGMAWATSASEATRFILMSLAVKRKLGIKTRLF